jgi:hypothetical protein
MNNDNTRQKTHVTKTYKGWVIDMRRILAATFYLALLMIFVFPATAPAALPYGYSDHAGDLDADDFTTEEAMEYLKKAIEQSIPHGYYFNDVDYEAKDEGFVNNDDDIYLLGKSKETVRGSTAYCFKFDAFRLFGGQAIVLPDGTVVFSGDVYCGDDETYKEYAKLFSFE